MFASGTLPSSVEVETQKVCAVIAGSHSVRVDHRNDFNFIVFAQILTLLLFGEQEIDESFTHKRTRSLSWMLPRKDDNIRSNF